MTTTQQTNEFRTSFFSSPLEDSIDIPKIVGQFYQYKWIILFVSLCTFTIAVLYSFTIQPQYKTTAMIQLSEHSNNRIASLKSDQASPAEAEMALLRTHYILEPVIIENHLNLTITPKYFPIFGNWMARHHQGSKLANPLLGLRSYSWGGEQIQVKYISIPANYEGQSFKLVARKHGTYQVYANQNELILSGKVGERVSSSNYPGISLELSTLKANPDTEFTISILSPFNMVNQLSHQLKLSKILSETSSVDSNTGLILLELIGSDPEQIKTILNAIVNYSVKKNVQLKSREAEKTLMFLRERLPILKKDLEKAEAALNDYHARTGTISMSAANQILMQELNSSMLSLERLKAQEQELLQIYTPNYPLVISNENKQIQLKIKLSTIKKQIAEFPASKQVEINFERDVKIKNKMYEALLNDMYQLEIVRQGLVGDVIALDKATPSALLSSNKLMHILGGFLIGMFLSMIAIVIKTLFIRTVEDANQLENEVQIPVKATIPFSKKQKQLEQISKRGEGISGKLPLFPLILAQHDPKDITIESLQSLRISLYISNLSATKNTIAIMGSLSGIGKSFVSLNLAYIFADSGKRTLLIDCDIRKGRLHDALFQEKTKGLSEYLAGEVSFDNLIRHIYGNLYFIPCGNHSRHPIELLKHPRFGELIERTKQEFDQVIVDTPPVLPVIDSILITHFCDTKLFVVGGSSDQLVDVKYAVKKVRAHGIELDGIVFNHRKPLARFGSKYAYYRYAYSE